MSDSKIIHLGIKGSVIAIDPGTGSQIWTTHLKGGGFVHVVREGEKLFASTGGEIFCLNAATGEVLWNNTLRGFGYGLCSIVTESNTNPALLPLIAEIERQRQHQATQTSSSGSN